jgi:hypothetical protein
MSGDLACDRMLFSKVFQPFSKEYRFPSLSSPDRKSHHTDHLQSTHLHETVHGIEISEFAQIESWWREKAYEETRVEPRVSEWFRLNKVSVKVLTKKKTHQPYRLRRRLLRNVQMRKVLATSNFA